MYTNSFMASFLRSCIFYVLFFPWLVIMSTIGCLPLPMHLVWKVVRSWARVSLLLCEYILGINYVITGQLPCGNVVIACQHQSYWETFAFFALIERPCYIMKDTLYKIPIFGNLMRKIGMIAVARGGGASAIKSMISNIQQAISATSVIIFPEGTRVQYGHKGNIKRGIQLISNMVDSDIVPVTIDSGKFWPRRAFIKTSGTIHLNIMSPIKSKDVIGTLKELFYPHENSA